MGQASVSMGLNTELVKGTKFDRFQPNIGMSVDITSEGLSVEEQVAKQEKAIKYIWDRLSEVIETKINEELAYETKWKK